MQYYIYELVESSVLTKLEEEENDILVLRKLGLFLIDNPYSTEIEAQTFIVAHSSELKNKDLVILPVIKVDWEGKVI